MVNRRTALQMVPASVAASAAACAQEVPRAVAPAPGPPQQTPPEPAAPAAPADTTPGWEREWEELVAAAKEEGTLSLLTVVGRGYGALIARFEQMFPGIGVQHLAESSADTWLRLVRQGRQAGGSAFDIALGQPDRALTDGTADGMWAPLKPLLFRPDVLDDAAWWDGLGARYLDVGGSLRFAWSRQVFHAYAVNTDLVPATAIKSVLDLLDPRWRGKIVSPDPRLGMGLLVAASVAARRGNDVLKRLIVDQRPVLVDGGPTSVTEPLARGRYPIALGVRPKALDPLRAQGIGHQVWYLDLPDADFVVSSTLLYFDRAPHPAAARLFANWVLTQEAQTLLANSLPTNSARTDVAPGSVDETGATGNTYYEPGRESNFKHAADTERLVRDLRSQRR